MHPIVLQMEPSAEQLPAVLARGVDVLVTAGAGTGKTRTLTARFLALLSEGVRLRSIVAVTFTRKAAREMRNRVRGEVQRYLGRSDLDAAERHFWNEIAREIDAARIDTIHALCGELLRSHPAEAALDPAFAVLDEAQAELAVSDAVEETLAWALLQPELAELVQALGVEGLADLLGQLLQQRLALGGLLDGSIERRMQARLAALEEELRAAIGDDEVGAAARLLQRAFAAAPARAEGDALYPHVAAVATAWPEIEAAVADGRACEAGSRFLRLAHSLKMVGRKENWAPFDAKGAVRTLRAHAEAIDPGAKCDPALDELAVALMPALRTLFAQAERRYAATRTAQRALDFDDLEAGALRLLREHASVRERWHGEIAALLVDEFQDTNARQRDLVRLLAGAPGRLFFVGDAKQSIYRFRGADVAVFRAERQVVQAAGGTLAELSTSYRSHAVLMERLNALLRPILGSDDSIPWREPFAPLAAVRASPAPPASGIGLQPPYVELQLVRGTKTAGGLDGAARLLAQRLHAIHRDGGVAWGEMALLCRSTHAFQAYEDAFEAAAIPYVTVAGRGFYERPEVRDVLNLLRAVADPTDNLALAGFLRSPVVGLPDSALLTIYDAAERGASGRLGAGALRAALRTLAAGTAAGSTPDLLPLWARADSLIDRLHRRAGRATVADLIQSLYEATGYPAALVKAGQARAARNLAKLLEDAHAGRLVSVMAFLESVERLRREGTREGEARADEPGAVQIMTVHAAKGLEFAVVALGDAAAEGGRGRSALLLDEDGLLLGLGDGDGRSGLLWRRGKAHEEELESAESERLLYVAATRARDLLLVSGCSGRSGPGGWLGRLLESAGLFDLLDPTGPAQGTRDGVRVHCVDLAAAAALSWPEPPAAPPPAAPPSSFDPSLLEPVRLP